MLIQQCKAVEGGSKDEIVAVINRKKGKYFPQNEEWINSL
jgi:hypothetical protein